MTITREERIRGSIVGGAIGDALGAGIEFLDLEEIEEEFGPGGVKTLTPYYGHDAPITDDTQMTLFTAEGLLVANVKGTDRVEEVWNAYQRWLCTQETASPDEIDLTEDGLIGIFDLHTRRAPGNTCISALKAGEPGTPSNRINGSKGCGGIMRAAPAGMVTSSDEEAYELGCEIAALTHGHPCGWISAGVQAVMVRRLLEGESIQDAVDAGREMVVNDSRDRGVLEAIDSAIELASQSPLDGWKLSEVGLGWIGEEALAIAVACLLAQSDPNEALLLAVNHSGDSDSTGAIVGNLVGAHYGIDALREDWCREIELRSLLDSIADQIVSIS